MAARPLRKTGTSTGTGTGPWSGATITEIPMASADDLDEAFTAAAKTQRDWAAGLRRSGPPS